MVDSKANASSKMGPEDVICFHNERQMGLAKMNKLFPDARVQQPMFEKSKELDLGEFGILRTQNVTCVPQYQF